MDLRLNQEYFADRAPAAWNAEAIRQRAQWLLAKANELWPQLGDSGGYLEEKPKSVVILGEVHPIYSWRDVLRRTSEVAAQWCNDNFEETVIANRASYFTRTPTSDAWYELPNG